jgi:PAS domain S-box-containing protein
MEAASHAPASGWPKDPELFGGPAGALAFIRSVLEASTDYSIIATDLLGEILLWNEGARRLYGYESDEILSRHKSVLHVNRDARAGLPQTMMDQALESGKWEGLVDRARKDGTSFTARAVMTLRRSEAGTPLGFLLMSRDAHDDIKALHQPEQANASAETRPAELETTISDQTWASSSVSQRWRDPLTSLIMLAGVLRDNQRGTLAAEEVRYASAIHESGSDLLDLLNGSVDPPPWCSLPSALRHPQ